MKIRLSDTGLLPDLLAFLRRSEYDALYDDRDDVIVAAPPSRSFGAAGARLDLELRLRSWQARHPGVEVGLVETVT